MALASSFDLDCWEPRRPGSPVGRQSFRGRHGGWVKNVLVLGTQPGLPEQKWGGARSKLPTGSTWRPPPPPLGPRGPAAPSDKTPDWGSRRLKQKARHSGGGKRKHTHIFIAHKKSPCVQRPAPCAPRSHSTPSASSQPASLPHCSDADTEAQRKPVLGEPAPTRPGSSLAAQEVEGPGEAKPGWSPSSPSHAGVAEPLDARSIQAAFSPLLPGT